MVELHELSVQGISRSYHLCPVAVERIVAVDGYQVQSSIKSKRFFRCLRKESISFLNAHDS
uniref:Uncharacterized protein n=1 Tax=Parascaris equorum TaxID=6256 RepID=A0A914RV66_PAREQ